VNLHANAAFAGSWNLGLPDVYRIRNVYANTTQFSDIASEDITSRFMLDTGQRDQLYDHARLVLKPQFINSLGDEYLTVKLDHFLANTVAGIGFFSVDSYAIDDANTSNVNAIQ